jgi:hypothetical protein
MDEDHIKVNTDEALHDRVTIREASTLLGVHPNTVRKRVKDGVYEAEKISTEHGFTWMIHRNTLLNTSPTTDTQISPLQSAINLETTPEAFVQGMLRPFVEDLGRVREELGAERVLREQAERERDELRRRLEALQKLREASVSDSEKPNNGDDVPADQDEPKERRSWLHRFFFGP